MKKILGIVVLGLVGLVIKKRTDDIYL